MWATARSIAAKTQPKASCRGVADTSTVHSKIALMFPGQGAQRPGMGADLVELFPYTKHVADSVDQALGFFLSRRMMNQQESIVDTRLTQPAMLLHSSMLLEVMQKELDFVVSSSEACPVVATLGHSVGEISALSAAGSLSTTQAASLLAARGNAMALATEASQFPTGMSALLPASHAAVRAAAATACTDAKASGQPGVAVAANLNSAKQTVVSGHQHIIDAVIASLKENGRLRAVQLAVSAPFHSPVLLSAVPHIAQAIAPGRQLVDTPLPNHLLEAAFGGESWFAQLEPQQEGAVSLQQLCTFIGSHFGVPTWEQNEGGADEDDPALASLLQRGATPVYSNVTAAPHSFGGDDAALALALQAIAPVQWHRTMQNVLEPGDNVEHEQPNVLVEIGPGSTLSSLARQIAKEPGQSSAANLAVCNLDTASSVAALVRRAEKAPLGLHDVGVWQESLKSN